MRDENRGGRRGYATQSAAVEAASDLLAYGYTCRVIRAGGTAPRSRQWVVKAWDDDLDGLIETLDVTEDVTEEPAGATTRAEEVA